MVDARVGDGLDQTRWPVKIGLAAAAVGVLTALVLLQGTAEGALAEVVRFLPLGHAFGAGAVASVNPCGFMLLPAYLSYQVGAQAQQ